jgi:hypothetical protein
MDTFCKKYLIYAFTFWCIIAQVLFGWIIPLIIVTNSETHLNFMFFIVTFLIINFIVGLLVRNYLLKPIEIILTESKITLNYLSINRSKIKRSISTSLDKISRFSDYSDGRDLKFKLFFVQGQTFTLYKSGVWNKKDDFETLINDFKLIIENYNEKQAVNDNKKVYSKIKYGDNTYLTISIITFVGSFFLLLMLVDSAVKKDFNNKALLGFILLLGFGVINLIIHKNRKRKG